MILENNCKLIVVLHCPKFVFFLNDDLEGIVSKYPLRPCVLRTLTYYTEYLTSLLLSWLRGRLRGFPMCKQQPRVFSANDHSRLTTTRTNMFVLNTSLQQIK